MENKEEEHKHQNASEEITHKHDADNGNDSHEILQKEKLIDRGNEHKHDAAKESALNKEHADQLPPEPEGDGIDDGQKQE